VNLRAMQGTVLITDIERGPRLIGGIWLPNDDGTNRAIRPHWAKVYSVGSDITEIKAGQWILIKHARWTREITLKAEDGTNFAIWAVDWPDAVLLVSDDMPDDSRIFSSWA
jgi:hypothetical protein